MKINKKVSQSQRYLEVYMGECIPLRNMEDFDYCDDGSVDETNFDTNESEWLLAAQDLNASVPFDLAHYEVGGEADDVNIGTDYDASVRRSRRLVYRLVGKRDFKIKSEESGKRE